MSSAPDRKTAKSNTEYFLSPSVPPREIITSASSSSFSQTTNFDFFRLLLLVISFTSTCSLAQDTSANTGIFVPDGRIDLLKVTTTSKTKTLEGSKKFVESEYVCPNYELAGFALVFGIPCITNSECIPFGSDQRCCRRFCRKGIPPPPKEPEHRAVLGLNRTCPKQPVPEILPVKKCLSDIDCEKERRVCCPDKDLKLYCRTAAPVWSELPFPRAHEFMMSVLEYMQCEKAPPQLLDLFSQPCNRTIECLPNLCCQEGPGKFCRPAKRSLLGLVAQATQRFARG